MKRLVAVIAGLMAVSALLVVACADDGKGVSDLPEENVQLDTEAMDVIVSADQFPNIGHKCKTFGSVVIGFWTTTDRTLILVYNDHACEGSSVEREMTVINGVPRAVVSSGG